MVKTTNQINYTNQHTRDDHNPWRESRHSNLSYQDSRRVCWRYPHWLSWANTALRRCLMCGFWWVFSAKSWHVFVVSSFVVCLLDLRRSWIHTWGFILLWSAIFLRCLGELPHVPYQGHPQKCCPWMLLEEVTRIHRPSMGHLFVQAGDENRVATLQKVICALQ